MRRREFLAAGVAVSMAPALSAEALPGIVLEITETIGALRKDPSSAPIDGAAWYIADEPHAGFLCRFPAGKLADVKFIAADLLLDGDTSAVFQMTLQEGEKGRRFRLGFSALNQCSLRMRMSTALVDQNRWQADREGAFLKPLVSGDRVELDKVDRIAFVLLRKGPKPARWAMTPIHVSQAEVPKLEKLVLPKGPLLDEFGQSNLRNWQGRTRSEAELKRRILGQYERAPKMTWPAEFTRWGGWKAKKLGQATGYFRTHHDGRRWWLVDPDGCAFWSAGADCVRVDADARIDGIEAALKFLPPPDGDFAGVYGSRMNVRGRSINYLAANMIRSFGKDGWREKWAAVALSEMKRLRFNTVGNWSEHEFAAKAKFPYVRPLSFRGERSGLIYRDFPDVFHPGFEQDAAEYASQLKSSANDPAFIGYFLMNEPTWGFSSEVPGAGMLYTSETCHTRTELAKFLKQKYGGDDALSAAWKRPASFDRIERGRWTGTLGPEAVADLRAFSSRMVERYFSVISKAAKAVDPNHLNLGMRWAGVPPEWASASMKFFDVFSLNCYMDKLPRDRSEQITKMLNMPVMVGEWHFGALDVGLPASGIGHLKNQEERAKAYRIYLEDAAANVNCVGVHWFTLYDQSALGRFDGENYNIGFLDICNRPYDEMGKAAVASHERMYQVADGKAEMFTAPVEYLPKLFL